MRRMRRSILGGRGVRRILRPLELPAIRRLRRAQALREAGDYVAAAGEFHDLAVQGEVAGIPRSVQAFLLAGQCFLLAGLQPQGMEDLRHAVDGARRFEQLDRLQAAGPRIAGELRQAGLAAEAQAFLESLGAGGAPASAPFDPAALQARLLPPKCPYCGGTIHPGEVEWIDEVSAACDYCGSVVQAAKG